MGTGVKNKKIDLSCIRSDGFALYKDGKIWTEAFCRALNEYAEIYIPAGKYYIDRSLIVPSDTRILADEHAEIILIKGAKTLLLRNENVTAHRKTSPI